MESTNWERYGTESGNPKCANCMVHSGYEASAVHDNFTTWRGFFDTVKATFSRYRDSEALRILEEPVKAVHAPAGLVQLTMKHEAAEEVEV
jgi:hypothetical protein